MSTSVFSSEPKVGTEARLRLQVELALRRLAESTVPLREIATHTVRDRESDHYLVVTEGWQGFRRVYRTLVHLAVVGDDLHLYEDGTVDGMIAILQAVGVPKERIICEWLKRPAAPSDAGCR